MIKICGIRDAEAARHVAARGATAVGLNFYPRSPRAVSLETATHIVRSLPSDVEPVGLFVNETAERIAAACLACGLRTVQVHGDEPVDLLSELERRQPELRLIRACRLGPEGLDPIGRMLEECGRRKVRLWACLVDSPAPGLYGGSGQAADWERLRGRWPAEWPPLVLAGGLNPGNVAEAIRIVHPWGVDVASGVESSPGCKDLELVGRFVASARSALTLSAEGSSDG